LNSHLLNATNENAIFDVYNDLRCSYQ